MVGVSIGACTNTPLLPLKKITVFPDRRSKVFLEEGALHVENSALLFHFQSVMKTTTIFYTDTIKSIKQSLLYTFLQLKQWSRVGLNLKNVKTWLNSSVVHQHLNTKGLLWQSVFVWFWWCVIIGCWRICICETCLPVHNTFLRIHELILCSQKWHLQTSFCYCISPSYYNHNQWNSF